MKILIIFIVVTISLLHISYKANAGFPSSNHIDGFNAQKCRSGYQSLSKILFRFHDQSVLLDNMIPFISELSPLYSQRKKSVSYFALYNERIGSHVELLKDNSIALLRAGDKNIGWYEIKSMTKSLFYFEKDTVGDYYRLYVY